MSEPSDSEIRQIVQRVLAQMTTVQLPPTEAPKATPPVSTPQAAAPAPSSAGGKKVAIGADHGGFELKEQLKAEIVKLGYEVMDVGTNSKDAVDYPDFALAVAQQVSSGTAWRGIMIDGAGIGSCIVCNKVPGVRAGMAYDYSSAVNSREHNDTNVLTLGAGLIGPNLAKQIVQVWLATPFGGGRHQGRINKILEVEKRYLK